MIEREVRDANNVAWKCVQAFSGISGSAAAEAAAELAESAEGTVPVVCTPSGGERTVRLELDREWLDGLPDEELVAAIEAALADA